MKKIGRLLTSLLPALLVLTLLAGNSLAALQAVGPTDPFTTIPAWYQDTNNLALVPCLDQNGFCLLPPPFDTLTVPMAPIATTGTINDNNFPGEAFYYTAGALMNIEAGERARLDFVLEFAFLGGVIPTTGTTFLRTDLQKMQNLATNATYRVTHPYGTFEFTTDAAGNTTGGGGVAVRQEDGTGTAADYLPPLMKAANATNIGPFLLPADGILPTALVNGETHTYIGDGVATIPVTGSPTGNNFFKIERLSGTPPAGSTGSTWQTNLFTLTGRVFTGQIPSPMNIDRVTYARDAASEQVDVFATALPTAVLTISGTGIANTDLTRDLAPNTTKYFTHIPLATTTLPSGLKINNSLDVPPVDYPVTLVDEVNISQAYYNPVTRAITIKAASRDKLAPLPTLTAPQFAAPNTLDATGTLVKTLPANTIPPMTVTVNSSKLGTATAFVSVVTPPAPPVAVADSATTGINTPVLINVLSNDTTDGTLDLTSVVTAAAVGGSAVANSNGTVTFTPAAGFTGAASFTYTVKDTFGQASNSAAVSVTVTQPSPASISSPANASTLPGASQTFTWNSVGADAYQIWVGTAAGTFNIAALDTTGTSINVTGLPVNGSTVFVRLNSRFGTTWLFNDYTYTASGSLTPSAMITPANGSTLAGASQTFTWNNTGASAYQLWFGSTSGASNLQVVNATTTSAAVTGLPVNGSTVFVRLYSKFGTTWLFSDTSYTASGTPTAATMISPANASTLAGSSQTFTWTNAGASAYQIWFGTSLGANNLQVVNATTTSAAVTGLPLNGSTIFVRLYSKLGATWQSNDYSYTAAGTPTPPAAAAIISPANASTLTGASQNLTWGNVGADAYQVWLGSTAGAHDLNVVNATSTSAAVTGFPANGNTVFLRLYSRFGTTWLFNDYTYTSNP